MCKLPTGSELVFKEATPPLSDVVPIDVAPFLNVTVPEGGAPFAVTVAVNVTGVPEVEGLSEDFNEVLVTSSTDSLTAGEVLGASLALPA
jgi:hypothetical protein